MKPNKVETYDWMEDFGPTVAQNLNELLIAEGIDPLPQKNTLHSGLFKDGKWVGFGENTNDYRNYWHAYLELWGDGLRNDNYQVVYFPHWNNDEEWDYISDRAEKWTTDGQYKHSDPGWARKLVTAVRKTLKENIEPEDEDGYKIVFWWCW